MSDLGSKHGAVITKPAPAATPTDNPPAEATHHDHTGDTRPSGLGGKDPPSVTRANAASPADASRSPVQQPPPSSKQKFFPVPIPREPEWVAGAHGDQISLGKTVMLLEREGGPEPPNGGRYRPAGAAAEEGAGVAGEVRPVPVKQPPRVISKGFAVNPNLVRNLFALFLSSLIFSGGCISLILVRRRSDKDTANGWLPCEQSISKSVPYHRYRSAPGLVLFARGRDSWFCMPIRYPSLGSKSLNIILRSYF